MNADMDGGRYQRDAALLEQAKGIMAQKSFLFLFFIAALMTCVGIYVVLISGVNGWILTAVVGLVIGGAAASGKLETVMMIAVACIAALTGVLSAIVVSYVFLGIQV